MGTSLHRRRLLGRRRRSRRHANGLLATISLERLEPRLLLSDLPRVVAHDLADYTTDRVTDFSLTLSDPVIGTDARDVDNYQLLHLGADQAVGGGDDHSIGLMPEYLDGSTQITLGLETHDTVDLGNWIRDGHLEPGGGLGRVFGTWEPDSQQASVVHVTTESDYPSYFLTDSDVIDQPFYARATVESDAGDDMIGLIFSLQHRFYGSYDYGPDTFYALTWKQTTEDKEFAPEYIYTAEEGLKLLRFENLAGTSAGTAHLLLWDGDYTWADRMSVLDTHLGDDLGWEPNVEYGFALLQQGDGTIDLTIERTSDGSIIWQTTVQDPDPLPAGKVGFLNCRSASNSLLTPDTRQLSSRWRLPVPGDQRRSGAARSGWYGVGWRRRWSGRR